MPPKDRPRATPGTPSIIPVFPLLLLETMRDMDRPEEVLEGEDFSLSMPRRLGLSDVVYTQIHRFREEVKRKSLQTSTTVEDLIRLVIRRPDAEEIFAEAGRRVARWAWQQRSGAFRRSVRLLPASLSLRSARRATERLFAQLVGDAEMAVTDKPIGAVITGSVTSRADPGGAACAFYTGVLSELVSRYTGRRYAAQHPRCAARGADRCEWRALVVA
ncbi:MAG TPA: V4R domain-containing protein [Longimicrobiaceae bacterium]|nr:V4R domain-containing protein [Longimicrobiaceae bacterium]